MPVLTRYQTKQLYMTREKEEKEELTKQMNKCVIQPYIETIIDFDGASRAWRANKRHIGNGYFLYKKQQNCIQDELPSRTTNRRTRHPPVRYDPAGSG